MVQTPECLPDAKLIAEGPASVIQPDPLLRHRPHGLDIERVIVHPRPDRVPEPSRLSLLTVYLDTAAIHEFVKWSTVGPDDAPLVVVLVQHRDLVLVLKNLDAEIVVVMSRQP